MRNSKFSLKSREKKVRVHNLAPVKIFFRVLKKVRKILTTVKDFLCLGVIGTEGTVEFESVDISGKDLRDLQQDALEAADLWEREEVVATQRPPELVEKVLLETEDVSGVLGEDQHLVRVQKRRVCQRFQVLFQKVVQVLGNKHKRG